MIRIVHTNCGKRSYYEIIGKNGRPMIFKFKNLDNLKKFINR